MKEHTLKRRTGPRPEPSENVDRVPLEKLDPILKFTILPNNSILISPKVLILSTAIVF